MLRDAAVSLTDFRQILKTLFFISKLFDVFFAMCASVTIS